MKITFLNLEFVEDEVRNYFVNKDTFQAFERQFKREGINGVFYFMVDNCEGRVFLNE